MRRGDGGDGVTGVTGLVSKRMAWREDPFLSLPSPDRSQAGNLKRHYQNVHGKSFKKNSYFGKQEDGLAGGSLLVLEGLDGVNGRTWSRRPVSPCGQPPGDHPRTPGSYRRTLSYQWFSLLSFFHPRSFCLFRVPKSCR